MAKATIKKAEKKIEEVGEIESPKVDKPIEDTPPIEAIKVEAAPPKPPAVKVEEILKPIMPQVIIVSGGQHVALEAIKIEGETFEEKVLNYVKGKGASIINDLLRIEYKHGLRLQRVNKEIKTKLQGLVDSGKISVTDNAHKKLGGFYYDGVHPETQYYTVKNTRIEITAL
jgi:hypothetical protein